MLDCRAAQLLFDLEHCWNTLLEPVPVGAPCIIILILSYCPKVSIISSFIALVQ